MLLVDDFRAARGERELSFFRACHTRSSSASCSSAGGGALSRLRIHSSEAEPRPWRIASKCTRMFRMPHKYSSSAQSPPTCSKFAKSIILSRTDLSSASSLASPSTSPASKTTRSELPQKRIPGSCCSVVSSFPSFSMVVFSTDRQTPCMGCVLLSLVPLGKNIAKAWPMDSTDTFCPQYLSYRFVAFVLGSKQVMPQIRKPRAADVE
mmetsp:Transcript_46241/g.83300  ORF Transcript_46241/g.83300 Transcript_46241/m.83300 type:complete len:208 (-) Transcript_46241:590-1213(-)